MNCLENRIKWRGKLFLDKTKWIYGTLTSVNKHTCNIDIFKSVMKSTVGQYTGYKDKNGKEIYEGDIIKSYINNDIYEIEYNFNIGFCLVNLHTKLKSYGILRENNPTYEVIGNIYDNPNLIDNND